MAYKLFVYGTLHPKTAPPEVRDDVRRLRPEGKGTIRGRLLNLGEYPGVVQTRGAGEVSGHVFSLPPDPKLLDRLDKYEEYYADDTRRSLFLRKLVNVKREDGTVERCWVYVLNPAHKARLLSAS